MVNRCWIVALIKIINLMYLMSKHKSNNQLVKEIASTAIPINSGNGIDLEFLPSFLQSNIIQKTFNISDRWSQTIRSILSLDQTSVAQYGNFYIETFAEPASVGYRSFPPLGNLPLDILSTIHSFIGLHLLRLHPNGRYSSKYLSIKLKSPTNQNITRVNLPNEWT